jgi:hypothetical protein
MLSVLSVKTKQNLKLKTQRNVLNREGKEWSGRKDLNLRPPGPEPTHRSRENQSKALNRRRIDEQLSLLIGLLIGLQIVKV